MEIKEEGTLREVVEIAIEMKNVWIAAKAYQIGVQLLEIQLPEMEVVMTEVHPGVVLIVTGGMIGEMDMVTVIVVDLVIGIVTVEALVIETVIGVDLVTVIVNEVDMGTETEEVDMVVGIDMMMIDEVEEVVSVTILGDETEMIKVILEVVKMQVQGNDQS